MALLVFLTNATRLYYTNKVNTYMKKIVECILTINYVIVHVVPDLKF